MEKNTDSILWYNRIPIDLHAVALGLLSAAIITAIAVAIWFIISRGLNSLQDKSRVSAQIMLPLRMLLRYGILFASIVLILTAFGVPIGNFWTFVSTILGLIAIGFVAVWSVLSNISATFFIIGFKPFRVGDYVRLVGDEVSGRVIDINFMFTTLQRTSGDLYKIPNNQFFQKTTLRPSDGGKSDEEEKEEKSNNTAKTPDHSQQNLEGIVHDTKR